VPGLAAAAARIVFVLVGEAETPCPISCSAISAAPWAVENVATAPPDPPYSVELTMTIVTCAAGTCACATALARTVSHVSRRRMTLPLQNVESKYVRATAPEPALPSPHVTGSSAPLSVEITSTRWMLMPHHRSPNGAAARNASTNAWTSA
jgi:hypothetical protein